MFTLEPRHLQWQGQCCSGQSHGRSPQGSLAYRGLTEADKMHLSRCKSRLQTKSAVELDFRIRHPDFMHVVLSIGAVYSEVASTLRGAQTWQLRSDTRGLWGCQSPARTDLSQLLVLAQPAPTHQCPSLPKAEQS